MHGPTHGPAMGGYGSFAAPSPGSLGRAIDLRPTRLTGADTNAPTALAVPAARRGAIGAARRRGVEVVRVGVRGRGRARVGCVGGCAGDGVRGK